MLKGVKYIALETNMNEVIQAQKEGKNIIFGNAGKKSILESVNIRQAMAVIVSFDNIEKLHLVCGILNNMKLNIPIVIKVDRFIDQEDLQKEFPHFQIVVGTEQVAQGMVNSLLKCDVRL